MPDLNLEKLADFREAHETRRLGLASHSPTQLERAATLYEKLGCPVNAEKVRFVVTHPKYFSNYTGGE